MFVKICGITNAADAVAAVEAGADAIGLIFAPSRRHVTVAEARAVVAEIPDGVLAVGVFRGHLAHEMIDIAGEVGLDAAQIPDPVTPETSHAVHAEVPVLIRALSVEDPDLATIDDHGADAVHLDAPIPGGGVPFDWSLVGDLTGRHRIILAGGLRPDTVAGAVATVGPWGVDVASGVESGPGRKDHDALRRFVAEARQAFAAAPSSHPPLATDRNLA